VVEALAEQLAPPGSADDLVFVGPQGGTLRLAGFRHRIWRPATRASGLEGLRIHDLRHTAVALWIAAGANPKEVAARAGHTSVSFTLDRYGHLYPDADQALRDRLDACMRCPRHTSRQPLTDQRRTRWAARDWKAHLNRRRIGVDLQVWLVGVTGLEPVTSSL
jgi:hypothetical protein